MLHDIIDCLFFWLYYDMLVNLNKVYFSIYITFGNESHIQYAHDTMFSL
jgi:hypothetical protein